MENRASYNQILKSSAIVGGSSGINILIGLVRVKVLALMLGAPGVGLLGLFQSLLGSGTTLMGLGMAGSAVREIAASGDNTHAREIVRRSLWWGSLVLGVLAIAIVWILSEAIARTVFGDGGITPVQVRWIGFGILFNILAASQTSLLRGMRRLKEFVAVTILSALAGTIAGIIVIWQLGMEGIVWFVVLVPATGAGVAFYFTRAIRGTLDHSITASDLFRPLKSMIVLGAAFTTAEAMNQLTQLAVRVIVNRELGIDATGHFQAAWTISMTYLGFILNAMAMDYYPRLTQVIGERATANMLVRQQSEVALLLGGPVILAMIALSPWIIQALYAPGFEDAAKVLRWQLIGDVIKISTWPMGFMIIARGEWKIFIATQLTWNAAYAAVIWSGIHTLGIEVSGMAYVLSYAVLFVLNLIAVYHLFGYTISGHNLKTISASLFASIAALAGVVWLGIYGTASILLVAAAAGWYSLRKLAQLTGNSSIVAVVSGWYNKYFNK